MKHPSQFMRNQIAAAVALLLALAASTGCATDTIPSTNAAPPRKSGNPPVVGVGAFLKDPQLYSAGEIVLQGFVTDVCKRKGCWALLHDNDPDAKGQVRVKQNEDGDTFKAFLPELLGKTILVTGKVKETKIDNEYLDKWETSVKAAREKAVKAEDKKSGEGDSYDAILKQIAGLRKRAAKAPNGWFSSYSLIVDKWEPQTQ
jgi:hypothetical protein